MSLVRAILRGIADDRPIDRHISIASPLRDLIEQYNKVAITDDNLPPITALSKGSELKEAIDKMDPEIQVKLLHKYSQSTKTLNEPTTYAEEPSKVEERKFKIWVAKIALLFVSILMLVVIGAIIAISVKSGTIANEGLISTIMTAATEIIKVALGSK